MRIYLAAKIAVALAEGGMRFTFPPYGNGTRGAMLFDEPGRHVGVGVDAGLVEPLPLGGKLVDLGPISYFTP